MTQTGRCCSKLPALCLGLFWGFLLIGIIMKYNYHISSKAEIESLKSRLRNMSKERDQLSSLVHNLTGQLLERGNYNSVSNDISSKAEIESLKSHLRNMSKERDQLSSLVHNLTGQLLERGNYNSVSNAALAETELEAWKKFGSSYYYISNVMKTWDESRRLCLERGADLVIINDKAEQEFIYNQSIYTWIGLSDVQSEGVWKWVDGSPLTNGFWKKGEPNNAHEDEDCVAFLLTNRALKTWNDIPCTYEACFICESAKLPLKRVKLF